jgi:L-threonylcarbamoyladenylate synthase
MSDAIRILRSGGLVAFPTETVYGLGADATSTSAIARIFAAKGRPSTNPLIVHIADATVARRYTADWSDMAEKLAAQFWPGPLTLVVHKSDVIVPEATAGRDTVGLRSPDHPLALQLLREFDGPIAAPSANRSNRISPTTADHVRMDLQDRVDLILDGGPCRVGIESTVLDLSNKVPTLLRPGGISRAQIEAIIGPIAVFACTVDSSVAASSPGQQAVHYAPLTPAYRFERADIDHVYRWLHDHRNSTAIVFRLGSPADATPLPSTAHHQFVWLPNDAAACARQLYAALHAADAAKVDSLWIEMPPPAAEWIAVRDRLSRATIDGQDLLRSS